MINNKQANIKKFKNKGRLDQSVLLRVCTCKCFRATQPPEDLLVVPLLCHKCAINELNWFCFNINQHVSFSIMTLFGFWTPHFVSPRGQFEADSHIQVTKTQHFGLGLWWLQWRFDAGQFWLGFWHIFSLLLPGSNNRCLSWIPHTNAPSKSCCFGASLSGWWTTIFLRTCIAPIMTFPRLEWPTGQAYS